MIWQKQNRFSTLFCFWSHQTFALSINREKYTHFRGRRVCFFPRICGETNAPLPAAYPVRLRNICYPSVSLSPKTSRKKWSWASSFARVAEWSVSRFLLRQASEIHLLSFPSTRVTQMDRGSARLSHLTLFSCEARGGHFLGARALDRAAFPVRSLSASLSFQNIRFRVHTCW